MFGVPTTKKFFQDGQAYEKEVKSHGGFHGRLKCTMHSRWWSQINLLEYNNSALVRNFWGWLYRPTGAEHVFSLPLYPIYSQTLYQQFT